MEIRKLSSPPEPEEIRSMVRYAKNVIEEFRRAKHYKNILFLWPLLYFFSTLLFQFSLIWSLPLSVCQFVSFLYQGQPFTSLPPLISLHCFCHYSLTLWHPPVSCWRCVSLARRRWELYLQIPTSTCCTWCIRPWVSVSTCRTGMELWATERRSFSHTGKLICKGSAER